MMPAEARYTHLIKEYVSLSEPERSGVLRPDGRVDWDRVECLLEGDAEWTARGAHEVACLACNYGYFILENAAALARALRLEDGALGL